MPILTGDIIQYLSSASGSTGGERSPTALASGVVNNLWPDISDAERMAGGTRFRKTFWKNNNGVEELILPIMYLPTPPIAGTVSLGLGFDSADDSDETQGNMTALTTPSLVAVISDEADSRVVTVWGVDDLGNAVTEDITLNGTTQVVGITTFTKVWAVVVEATSGTADIEVRQGAGGGVIGTIPATKVCCWFWVINPISKGGGIALPDLPAGDTYGMWRRLSWSSATDPARPDSMTTAIEEA